MKLVYKFNNYKHNEELFKMCRFSKDLYNQTMYIVKTNLKDGKFLFYNDLDKILNKIGYQSYNSGGSHFVYRKNGFDSITLPKHKPMKECYAKMVLKIYLEETK